MLVPNSKFENGGRHFCLFYWMETSFFYKKFFNLRFKEILILSAMRRLKLQWFALLSWSFLVGRCKTYCCMRESMMMRLMVCMMSRDCLWSWNCLWSWDFMGSRDNMQDGGQHEVDSLIDVKWLHVGEGIKWTQK